MVKKFNTKEPSKILLKILLSIIVIVVTISFIFYFLLQDSYKRMDKMSVPVKMEDLKRSNPEMYNEIMKDTKKIKK